MLYKLSSSQVPWRRFNTTYRPGGNLCPTCAVESMVSASALLSPLEAAKARLSPVFEFLLNVYLRMYPGSFFLVGLTGETLHGCV